jgi:predicted RNA-binding Zn-ribbon protein involved in translation (DUF1610 family)
MKVATRKLKAATKQKAFTFYRRTTVSNHLKCPHCGNDEFDQTRSMIYDEYIIAKFNANGHVEDEIIEATECSGEDSAGPYECKQCGWQLVNENGEEITTLLLLDPAHQGRVDPGAGDGQIAIPGGDLSAVQVPTGIGDGRYRVEGRAIDSPIFGKRIAEIRLRFLDEQGNWLGGD